MIRYKLLIDYRTFGTFIPAGTKSTQMTEAEYERNGVLPELRTYGDEALSYFKFQNAILPVNKQTIDAYPECFELIKEEPPKPERIEVRLDAELFDVNSTLLRVIINKPLSSGEGFAIKVAIEDCLNGGK